MLSGPMRRQNSLLRTAFEKEIMASSAYGSIVFSF